MLLLVLAPTFFMEITIAQHCRLNVVKLFRGLVPILGGVSDVSVRVNSVQVGWCVVLYNLVVAVVSMHNVALLLYYASVSVAAMVGNWELPWFKCGHEAYRQFGGDFCYRCDIVSAGGVRSPASRSRSARAATPSASTD